MRTKMYTGILILLISLAAGANGQTSTFTYQGRLTDAAVAANGTYQMTFSLFDALSGGTQQGATVTNNAVTVANGVFTVQLDFTAAPFATGANRWIEIAVKKPADPGFITLTPRQQLASNPFATRSTSAATADNATNLGGLAANTYLQTTGNGSQLTNLNGANITNNTISSAALASDTFPNNRNLSLLGQRRWDLLGQRVTVGPGPQDVAFDGANIWVTNFNTNNVTKLRASDGAVLGTFAVGSNPYGIAFDGANIWVANQGGNNVTKLRASDGVVQGTFAVGNLPFGVAFDGANIWVANAIGNSVTKLRASDGALLGTFAVGTGPNGVAFDGANIWVTNTFSNNLTRLRASDGAALGTFAVGSNPHGVAFDGANIWVANGGGDSVTKLRSTDGVLLGTFTVGDNPDGVAFDGANIWVGNINSNNLTKLRATDGLILGTFAVGSNPHGIGFDGANMWVANGLSNNVIKLPAFP